MPVLKYLSGGSYVPLPGGLEEVTISPNQPPVPTDLWLDTDDDYAAPDNFLSGFRNMIRNGDMGIAQRGGSFTVTGVAWTMTVDGWKTTHGAGTGAGATLYPINPGSNPLTDARNVLGLSQATGDATNNYFHLSQAIEDVRTLAGKVVTVSFVGYVTSGPAKISIYLAQFFGTGGSPSAEVGTLVGTVNLTTTPTRYTLTAALPSILGKTIGTNNDSNLRLQIWVSGGTAYAAGNGGIPVQLGTFCFTDVQVEAGPVATPFERLPQQQQMAWCYRYYQRIGNGASYYNFGLGVSAGADFLYSRLLHPMRATPTVSSSAASTFCISDGLAAPIAGTSFGAFSSQFDVFEMTVKATGTANRPYRLMANASALAYAELSAELGQ